MNGAARDADRVLTGLPFAMLRARRAARERRARSARRCRPRARRRRLQQGMAILGRVTNRAASRPASLRPGRRHPARVRVRLRVLAGPDRLRLRAGRRRAPDHRGARPARPRRRRPGQGRDRPASRRRRSTAAPGGRRHLRRRRARPPRPPSPSPPARARRSPDAATGVEIPGIPVGHPARRADRRSPPTRPAPTSSPCRCCPTLGYYEDLTPVRPSRRRAASRRCPTARSARGLAGLRPRTCSPGPRTVRMCAGLAGSASTLARSRLTCTSRVLVSPT